MFNKIKRLSSITIAAVTVAASLLVIRPVQVTAAGNCVQPYIPKTAAQVSEIPSTNIGVIGQRAPLPGNPTWDGDDRINDMVYIPTSNLIVAAGDFSSYIWQGTNYPRTNIVAFNASTGQPTAFAPTVDGEILSIAMSCTGDGVFIGGSFRHVNDATRNYTAKLNLANSTVADWNPDPNAVVEDIAMVHNHVVIAGRYTAIAGTADSYLTSVNQTTGAVDGWFGNIDIKRGEPVGPIKVSTFAPNHADTTAIILGNFNKVNGDAHRRIAVLDLSGAKAKLYPWATSWTASNGNSNTGTDCKSVFSAPDLNATWTPDDSRFLTASTGGPEDPGTICDSISKWNANTLTNTDAHPLVQQQSGGDTFSAVVCSNVNCYGSGHERFADNPPLKPKVKVTPCSTLPPVNMGTGNAGYDCKGPNAVDRPGVLEMSLGTMHSTTWNPGRSQQRGMHNVMLLTPQGLYLGTDGDDVGGQDVPVTHHNDLVLWPY